MDGYTKKEHHLFEDEDDEDEDEQPKKIKYSVILEEEDFLD